jgi:pimeloyl-ACP methyl ester carboxylesterase
MASFELSDGARLAFCDSGAGSPLILVHGSPGNARSWGRVARKLREDLRILTLDLPGYGGSTQLPAGTFRRTQAMGAAVERLMDFSAEHAWLCGHSYGGNVVLHAALRHHDCVNGIVLLEPVFMRALELAGEQEAFEKARAFFNAYVARVLAGESEAVSTMIEFWFGPGAFDRMPFSVQQFLIGAAAENAEDVRAAFSEDITREQLQEFDRPVLIAYGEASPPIAGAIANALAGLMPRAQVASIPDATHGMLDTHPESVVGLIERVANSSPLIKPA